MLDFVEFLSSDSDSDIEVQPQRVDETIVDSAPKQYANGMTVSKKTGEKKKDTLTSIHQLHTQ